MLWNRLIVGLVLKKTLDYCKSVEIIKVKHKELFKFEFMNMCNVKI